MQLFFAIYLVLTLEGVMSTQVLTQSLVDSLFVHYDASQIPICTKGGNTTVKFDVALRQIMDMDEKEQRLSINVWIRMRWTDCRLTWNPALYDNITHVIVSYDRIWTPDITLYDSAADEAMYPIRDQFSGKILSDGSMNYPFPSFIKSSCVVDVTFFPFDTQRCRLQFGSWSYDGTELDVVYFHDHGDISKFVDNMEWIVEEMPAERNVVYYTCCPEPFPDVSYYIVMRRRPTFYLLTMLFPCLLMSCIATLTFILPVESGEKVSLTITILLSLAVYMLIIADMLPPASNNFPILGIYFAVQMGIITMSCVQSVVVLNLFYRGTNGRKIPQIAKTILFDYLGKVLCFSSDKQHQYEKYIVRHNTDESHSEATVNSDIGHGSSVGCTTKSVVSVITAANINNMEPIITNNTKITSRNDNHSVNPTDGFVESHAQRRYLKSIDKYFKEKDREEDINSEWRDASNVLDRLFLVFYLLITVVVSLTLILHVVYKSKL